MKHAILRIAKAFGAFRCSRYLTRRATRILCYHGTWLGADRFRGDALFMQATTFHARLDYLATNGYTVVSLEALVSSRNQGGGLPDASVVITIDDGWYSTFADMLPALRKHAFPATMYCDTRHLVTGGPLPHMMAQYFLRIAGATNLQEPTAALLQKALAPDLSREERMAAALAFGQEIGIDATPYLARRVFEYMTPDELKEFAASPGCSVQLHTHRHTMGDHSAESLHQEVADNREALSRLLGQPADSFEHFCYPSGVFSQSAAEHLRQLGIASATSTQQGIAFPSADIMLLPRILDGENLSILEFEAEISGFMHLLRTITGRCRIGYDAPFS
ncbi:MAG: polysaccharide deacetylase family protein [Gemmatimonadales bacterium]|nr:polysaccharide deacetylase family protein [Gemmatimonadales bacterium]